MSDAKSANQIVTEIDDLLRDIWRYLDDPENLSKTILRVAVLNGGLANWLAEAQDIERRTEASYKHSVDEEKLRLVAAGDSATVAESKAKLETRPLHTEWLAAQHNSSVMKLKRASVDQNIDAARSRLAVIKESIRQA